MASPVTTDDVTSRLPDDITIDSDLGHRSQTDVHFWVTSDIMGHDVTSRLYTKDIL